MPSSSGFKVGKCMIRVVQAVKSSEAMHGHAMVLEHDQLDQHCMGNSLSQRAFVWYILLGSVRLSNNASCSFQ
jgi:hypothetical protein